MLVHLLHDGDVLIDGENRLCNDASAKRSQTQLVTRTTWPIRASSHGSKPLRFACAASSRSDALARDQHPFRGPKIRFAPCQQQRSLWPCCRRPGMCARQQESFRLCQPSAGSMTVVDATLARHEPTNGRVSGQMTSPERKNRSLITRTLPKRNCWTAASLPEPSILISEERHVPRRTTKR